MRAHLKVDYTLLLKAMNCIPRDNLARLTRGSQLVINTGHYQPFKTPPRDALSTNRSRETVWGIYEWLIMTSVYDQLASTCHKVFKTNISNLECSTVKEEEKTRKV